jgi:glycosyltransferase involved in cell wall biosynthesis
MFDPSTIPPVDSRTTRLCIVIPCYNEATKLKSSHFTAYLRNNPRVRLVFVNDGSKDGTLDALKSIQHEMPDQISIVDLAKNVGKGEAVRAGVLYTLDTDICDAIAYLDADLAVTLEECDTISGALNNDVSFCFGSRILRIGSVIERKPSRFIIGRAVATVISQILRLKVYDTQCGCKLFRRELAKQIFKEPFISRWLFDVEIFFRILQLHGREDGIRKMLEIPLNQWIDQGDSKVRPTYFFRMMVDLVKIRNRYAQKIPTS